MPLIYSFVARDGSTVLAEYTPYSGNFNTVAIECLQRMNNNESKFTIACDGHTFNFLTWNGFSECMQQPQQQQKGSHASERCACLQTCSCQLIWFHVCQENHGWRTAF